MNRPGWLANLWSHESRRKGIDLSRVRTVRTMDEELAMTCSCRFNAEWPEPPKDLTVAWAFEECGYHKDMREALVR